MMRLAPRITRPDTLFPDTTPGRPRTGCADALLLAAGHLARIIGLAALEGDPLADLAGARLAGGTADTLHLQRKADVLQHREMRQQSEVLEHHAHLVAADLDHLALGAAQQVAALEEDLAGGRLDQPRQAAHQGRLAGAAESHDDEDLAVRSEEHT